MLDFPTDLLYFQNRFISADISDLHTQRFTVSNNAAIPKLLGFHAVANNATELVNLDLAV